MLAGDFVRRAVGNVSSTISQASSSVSAAAQGKKRYDISDEAMEKCTLTVKVRLTCFLIFLIVQIIVFVIPPLLSFSAHPAKML